MRTTGPAVLFLLTTRIWQVCGLEGLLSTHSTGTGDVRHQYTRGCSGAPGQSRSTAATPQASTQTLFDWRAHSRYILLQAHCGQADLPWRGNGTDTQKSRLIPAAPHDIVHTYRAESKVQGAARSPTCTDKRSASSQHSTAACELVK